MYQPQNDNRREYFFDALNELLKRGFIIPADKVAYLGGTFGRGGTTCLEINEVDKLFSWGEKY